MTTLIIDADSIVYAAAFASQDWALFDEDGRLYGTYSLKSDAKEAAIHAGDSVEPFPRGDSDAKANCDAMVENIVDQFDTVDELQLWLTVPDVQLNFRYSVSNDYKANRKNFEKPFHYQTVRDRLVDHWGARISRKGWEADDELAAIGWMHWEHGDWSEEVVLCSIDKDLDNVPGHHYRWPTHNKEGRAYFVTEEEAMNNYWRQVLTGDTADNIRGLHRIGDKRAGSILSTCNTEKEYYNTCRKHWIVNLEKEGYSEDEAVEEMHKTCKLLYLMKGDTDEGWRPPE